jgi:propionyl-CoA synthetase
MNYLESYKQSIENPELFWEQQAKKISWHKEPSTILDQTGDYPKWFEGGYTNLCYLAVDKHIEDGFGEQNAIIYDTPVTQRIEKITFNQLHREVNKLAAAMKDLGLNSGDVAIIYMPMIPQAIYAMLACARIGVTHSVVFGGFAPNELAIRIDDCKPKIILTASSGIEVDKLIAYKPMVDEAINLAVHKPNHVVVYNRKFGAKRPMNEIDLDYDAFANNSKFVDCIPLPSNHPSYILYTSGTTGKPKGVVRDTGGYATALQFSMTSIYNIAPGKVFWAASDVGWVVGHSYIVYGPLINRNTTVLFEGKPIKTPDASTFWRVIAEHRVEVMFTAPTAIRAIRKEDPDGLFIKKFDLTCLKYQFLAGERCDISTLQWLEKQLNIPVIDHWWQTESGWPMVANPAGIELMPTKAGSAGLPVHGYNIQILNELAQELAPNCEGFVAVKLPLPPGTLLDIWQDNERFKNGYLKKFKGYYFSGDGGYKDEDGYVFITGRVDDVINVAGHRLSTAEMEEIVSAHTHVAECAVIGVNDQLKGQIPMAFVVEKNDNDIDQTRIQLEVILAVREKIGAVASLKDVVFVKRLPKTRSGKILRKLLRQIIDKEQFQIPSTIDDVAIIQEIEEASNTYFSNKTYH